MTETQVRGHGGEPVGRKLGVQRNEGRPGIQDAQHADGHGGGALDAKAHHLPPQDPEFPQTAGEAERIPGKIAVSEVCGPVANGERVRLTLRLAVHQVVNALLRDMLCNRSGQPGERGAFRLPDHRQTGDRGLRLLGDGPQEYLETLGQPLDDGGVEQIGAVLESPGKRRTGLIRHEKRQIELGGLAVNRHGGGLHPLQGQVPGAPRQRHGGLEQGMALVPALRLELFHQAFEGKVPVLLPGDHIFPDLADDVHERRVRRQSAAQHERVLKQADHAAKIRMVPAGDRISDQKVRLSARPVEQDREGRRNGHEEGGPEPCAQRCQSGAQLRVEIDIDPPAPAALRPPGPPSGGGKRNAVGCAVQVAAPVVDERLHVRAAQPVGLPCRVIGVLDRQLRQIGRPAAESRVVEGRKVPCQDVHGLEIRGHVMNGDHEHMVVAPENAEPCAGKRPGAQVEDPLRLCQDKVPDALVRILRRRQGNGIERKSGPVRDDLNRLAVLDIEGRAQSFVPRRGPVQGLTKGWNVERPPDPPCRGNVVERRARLEAVEKPETFLREGQRCREGTAGVLRRVGAR
jgi:hypothetical protein